MVRNAVLHICGLQHCCMCLWKIQYVKRLQHWAKLRAVFITGIFRFYNNQH